MIVNTPEYLAGFIMAKQGELQSLLDQLTSATVLTELEMHHMRQRVDLNDASIRSQHRDIHDRRLRPSLNVYEAVLRLTLEELTRREQHRGHRPPESEAMRTRRLRRDNPDDDTYNSDGRGPMPLEHWTTVEPAQGQARISADDLRRALNDRRSGRSHMDWDPDNPRPPNDQAQRLREIEQRREVQSVCVPNQPVEQDNEAGPSGIQQSVERPPTPGRVFSNHDDVSSSDDEVMSARSARSRSSINSYRSQYQESFTQPRRGGPLPPILDRNPVSIDRRDPDIIGMSEFYVRQPRASPGCPQCGEDHRLYRCTLFAHLNLLGRWFQALELGVCLNCLRWGHSSFTCLKPGNCHRCGRRHNSLLCPRHPGNR